MTDQIERKARSGLYDCVVSNAALIDHLRTHSLRTDGPFTLRSGKTASWYLDARQTTFSGEGAWLVGAAVLDVLSPEIEAVGGMTLGADPIAMATAMVASSRGRDLMAYSIRKEAKDHGTGGRVVGPIAPGARVAILEDTTTTGSAAVEATDVVLASGLEVAQALALFDRSNGKAERAFGELGIPYVALVSPDDLGVK